MTAVRLFGKLPAHGDFVARGLSAAERDELDAWLSAALADARVDLAEHFAERYDVAPPWRFASDGWAGTLVPSADAAGRRFPMLLAVAVEPEGAAAAAAACERLLYDAIVEAWSVDALAERAAALVAEAGAPPPGGWWSDATPRTLPGARPAGLLRAMLAVPERVA